MIKTHLTPPVPPTHPTLIPPMLLPKMMVPHTPISHIHWEIVINIAKSPPTPKKNDPQHWCPHQTYDNWPVARQNIVCARLVWWMLGILLRQEGEEPKVSEMFYRAVVQAVLLSGSETWVLLAAMERKVEITQTFFLRHIMGKWAQRIADGTWEIPGA